MPLEMIYRPTNSQSLLLLKNNIFSLHYINYRREHHCLFMQKQGP